MMVYICTKSHENILNGIRVMERTRKIKGRADGRTDSRKDGRRDPSSMGIQKAKPAAGIEGQVTTMLELHTRQIDRIRV